MAERKPSWSLRRGYIHRWDYHHNYHGWKKGSSERKTSARILWKIRGKCPKVASSGTYSSIKRLSNGAKLAWAAKGIAWLASNVWALVLFGVLLLYRWLQSKRK